jgi:hypothetical protein
MQGWIRETGLLKSERKVESQKGSKQIIKIYNIEEQKIVLYSCRCRVQVGDQ